MKRVVAMVSLLACGGPQPSRVELPPPPSASSSEPALHEPLDEIACKPTSLDPIEPAADGALDEKRLRDALGQARDFAQRCCGGDETGDATVRVTVSPDGYQTEIAIDPERLSEGPTGACLRGSFHRVIAKAFRGEAKTVSIDVHVR